MSLVGIEHFVISPNDRLLTLLEKADADVAACLPSPTIWAAPFTRTALGEPDKTALIKLLFLLDALAPSAVSDFFQHFDEHDPTMTTAFFDKYWTMSCVEECNTIKGSLTLNGQHNSWYPEFTAALNDRMANYLKWVHQFS